MYIYVLITSLIIHLMAEQLLLLGFIDAQTFSIPAVMIVLTLGPSLYYYTRTFYNLSDKNFILHIIPYQIFLAGIYFSIHFEIYPIPQWFFSWYYASVLATYLVLTLRLIRSHKLKKFQVWMKTIGIGFAILVLLQAIEVLLINIFTDHKEQLAIINTSFQNIFNFLFFILVIRQIITNPQPFSGISLRVPNKYNSSNVNSSELNLILAYVEANKAYQNPDLKSTLLSKETGLSVNQISEIINRVFKKNFNEWINDYRIVDAKRLITETDLSIKEIYFEVGFNSKSAFNTAFKSRADETPSGFRLKTRTES